MRLRCRPPNRPSPHCVSQKFLNFSTDIMRRVLEPYLFSALNRCRRVQLAVEQTCSHTVANWPVAVAQLARRSITSDAIGPLQPARARQRTNKHPREPHVYVQVSSLGFPVSGGLLRPQSMLLHTVLQEPLTDACCGGAQQGVCWSCCPSISNRSTSSSMGGLRTYMVGFHSATTWGLGPHQKYKVAACVGPLRLSVRR